MMGLDESTGLLWKLKVSRLAVLIEAARLEKLYTTEQKKFSEGTLKVIKLRHNILESFLLEMGELSLQISLWTLKDLFLEKQAAL